MKVQGTLHACWQLGTHLLNRHDLVSQPQCLSITEGCQMRRAQLLQQTLLPCATPLLPQLALLNKLAGCRLRKRRLLLHHLLKARGLPRLHRAAEAFLRTLQTKTYRLQQPQVFLSCKPNAQKFMVGKTFLDCHVFDFDSPDCAKATMLVVTAAYMLQGIKLSATDHI